MDSYEKDIDIDMMSYNPLIGVLWFSLYLQYWMFGFALSRSGRYNHIINFSNNADNSNMIMER